MDKHNSTIYGAERSQVTESLFANFSRKGNTLFMHVHFWPGSTVAVAGLRNKVKSARLFKNGQKVDFRQDDFRVQFTGLPERAPDELVSVIEVEFESEPKQDMQFVRKEKKREGV